MQQFVLRSASPLDFAALCALNEANVQYTSPLDIPRLQELHALACYHKVACVAGEVAAFLLAMGHDAPYQNENFAWFSQQLDRFIYIDRIVVREDFRGLQLASVLYDDLFSFARNAGIPRVSCEYNLIPPNEISRIFHARRGFTEIGSQWLAGGMKKVSLQVANT